MLPLTPDRFSVRGLLGPASRVLGGALIVGSFVAFGWVLSDAIRSADGLAPHRWAPLAGAAALHLVMLFFLMVLWERVLRVIRAPDVGSPAPPRSRAYTVYSRSWLARYIPGRIWSLAGRAWLAQRAGIPADDVARSVIIEVVLNYGMVTIISAAVLSGLYFHPVAAPAVFVVGVASFAVTLMKIGGLRTPALRQTQRFSAVRRLLQRAAGLAVGRSSPACSDSLKGIALYGCYSCMQLAFIVLIAAAFADLDPFMAAVIAGTWGLSLTAGWISFLPPVGLGARDGLAFVLFSQVLDVPAASSIVVASRILMVATDLAFVAAVEGWAVCLNRSGRLVPTAKLPAANSARTMGSRL